MAPTRRTGPLATPDQTG